MADTAIVYGFGFPVTDLKISTTLKFIKNHKEAFEKIANSVDYEEAFNLLENTDLDTMEKDEEKIKYGFSEIDDFNDINPNINYTDLLKAWDNLAYKMYGEYIDSTYLRELIAGIMHIETDISFEYQRADMETDCEGEPSILLSETLPWLYNSKERSLSEKELTIILELYAKELNIDTSLIDQLTIEYYCG